jgi:hypothetical protein
MIALLTSLALATTPPEARLATVQPASADPGSVSVLGLFQVRSTVSDLASTNPLLDGQVVGQLGGTNGMIVDPTVLAAHSEQRVGLFTRWAPTALSGLAALNGAVEVDFAFGDQAYGVGGNTGGGFGADQVNLQTRRLFASFYPPVGHTLHVALGLQFLADGVRDPSTATLDGLQRSGGRMMFFGSEAAGLGLYGTVSDRWGDRLRYRLGTFTLLEQGLAEPDDVWLSLADVTVHPGWNSEVGAHLWYLQDRSAGTGGALGIGPTSALAELQTGGRLDPFDGQAPPEEAELHADVVWTGVDGGLNPQLDRGPVGVHGLAIATIGRLYAPIVHDDDLLGLTVSGEVRWRYTAGSGSLITASALATTGDDADPQRYTGVLTGNAWGVAGAVHGSHGMLLLLPDPGSINRMVSVVPDISGGGAGVRAWTATAGYDPIPSRLTTTVGIGHATDADGSPLGTELNARVVGRPLPLLDLSLRAAVVDPGWAAPVSEAPWMITAAVDWLVFE